MCYTRTISIAAILAILTISCDRFDDPDAEDVFYSGKFVNIWKVDSAFLDIWDANGNLESSGPMIFTDQNGNPVQPVISLLNSGVYIRSNNQPGDTLYTGTFTVLSSMIRYSDRPGRDYHILDVNDDSFDQESERYDFNGSMVSERWYQSPY